MDYISLQDASIKWAISERRIQKLCKENRVDGAVWFGRAWAHEQGELLTERFVVLTRAASSDIVDVHDRMPVILHKNEISRWLKDIGYANEIMQREDVKLVREIT